MIEHVLRRIGRQDHPVCVFGQHRPETSGPASDVKNQPRLASHFERVTHQLLVTPERQAPGKTSRVRLLTDARVFLVVAPGELKLDGGWRLRGHV
jgi:hypothetical protein